MDDKTPTPDQTPEPAAGSTPDAPTVPVTPTPAPAAAPPAAHDAAAHDAAAHDAAAHDAAAIDAAAHDAAPMAAAPVATEAKPGRKRALLIGGGIVAAVLLAGGGVAVGAAIADDADDDDRPSISDGPQRGDADDRGGQREDAPDDAPDAGPGAGPDAGPGAGPMGVIGAASADDIIEITDAASAAADGEVTSIDAKRDGAWEVQLTAANGDETEVRVDAELATTVLSTDPADGDDTGPTRSLDDETIRSLVAAALAEADGMITDLDVDSDDVSPYDVSVLTSDNRSIDIDFSADFAVVSTDTDD